MRMLIALMIACCGITSAVSAENLNCNGFYIEGFAGPNWIQTKHKKYIQFDTGYVIGEAIGYRFANNLNIEGEFSYRYNRIFTHARGSLSEFAFMANAIYNIDLTKWISCYNIVPFIGGGVGYGHAILKLPIRPSYISSHKSVKIYGNNFAWQLMAGLELPLGPSLNASIKYCYHRSEKGVYNHAPTIAMKYFL